MVNDALVAQTRKNLHEAIQQFMTASFEAGVVIDFFVMAETVDADLDKPSDQHALYVGLSEGCSRWKLFGMTQEMAKYAYALQ